MTALTAVLPLCDGHLPEPVPCSRCGGFTCGECAGEAAQCRPCSKRPVLLPWDERETIGFGRGWLRTMRLLINNPRRAWEKYTPEGSMLSAFSFGAIMAAGGWLFSWGSLLGIVNGEGKLGKDPDEGLFVLASLAGGAAAAAVVFALASCLWAALDTAVMSWLTDQPASLKATYRAQAFSSTWAFVWCCFYPPALGVWVVFNAVLHGFAYRSMHRTSAARAFATAFTVPGLLVAALLVIKWF